MVARGEERIVGESPEKLLASDDDDDDDDDKGATA